MEHVKGTSTAPEGDGDEAVKKRAEFLLNAQKALSAIVLSIHATRLYLITSCETPNQVWKALSQHFERNTLANKLFLKKQCFRMEMKENSSIDHHLKDMKDLTDKLAALGSPVSEEDQIVTLLGILPPKFSTLVTALEAGGGELSLGGVQQALRHEELKLRGMNVNLHASNKVTESALAETQKRVCYECGKPGHIKRYCPERTNRSQPFLPHNAKVSGPSKSNESKPVYVDNLLFSAVKTDDCLNSDCQWIIDSGASRHKSHEKDIFHAYKSFEVPETVELGDGRSVQAFGSGQIRLKVILEDGRKFINATMCDVLYVPKLNCNLFSVRAAVSNDNTVRFNDDGCYICSNEQSLCGIGYLTGKLYLLCCNVYIADKGLLANDKLPKLDLWHQRLGHLNVKQLKEAISELNVNDVESGLNFCESCTKGKMHKLPITPNATPMSTTRKLQIVHSDLCGPMESVSLGGSKYFVTFIDYLTRCCKVYFLEHKSEVFEAFKQYEAEMTNATQQQIQILRSDNGGEYCSAEFESYLKCKGIVHQFTVPHTPEQNGVAERTNRTLMESARTMLSHANLPKRF